MKAKLTIIIPLLFLVQLCWGQGKEKPEKTVYLDAIQLQNIYEQWQTGKYEENAVFSKMDSIFRKYDINIEDFGKGKEISRDDVDEENKDFDLLD